MAVPVMTFLNELAARAWELITAGVLLLVVVGLFAGAGAPSDPEDGEEVPYDPDRERDWDIADQMEAM